MQYLFRIYLFPIKIPDYTRISYTLSVAQNDRFSNLSITICFHFDIISSHPNQDWGHPPQQDNRLLISLPFFSTSLERETEKERESVCV